MKSFYSMRNTLMCFGHIPLSYGFYGAITMTTYHSVHELVTKLFNYVVSYKSIEWLHRVVSDHQ